MSSVSDEIIAQDKGQQKFVIWIAYKVILLIHSAFVLAFGSLLLGASYVFVFACIQNKLNAGYIIIGLGIFLSITVFVIVMGMSGIKSFYTNSMQWLQLHFVLNIISNVVHGVFMLVTIYIENTHEIAYIWSTGIVTVILNVMYIYMLKKMMVISVEEKIAVWNW